MRRWRAAQKVLHGTLPRGTIARIAKAKRRLEAKSDLSGKQESRNFFKIANTEPRRADTSLSEVAHAKASEGPERPDHKPLMRNPSAQNWASPKGHTDSDTHFL